MQNYIQYHTMYSTILGMSKIQFEDNDSAFKSRALLGKPQTPGMIFLLMRFLNIKKERTAGSIILAVSLFFVLTAMAVIYVYVWPQPARKVSINKDLPAKVKAALPQLK